MKLRNIPNLYLGGWPTTTSLLFIVFINQIIRRLCKLSHQQILSITIFPALALIK